MQNSASPSATTAPTPMVATGGPRKRFFRKPGPIVGAAATFAAVLLMVVAVCLVWASATHQDVVTGFNEDRLRVVSRLLASDIGAVLAQGEGEVGTVNASLREAALRHQLTICRVVNGAGECIADASVYAVGGAQLPDEWPPIPEPLRAVGERTEYGFFRSATVLHVAGRGEALLEIGGGVSASLFETDHLQTGLILIGGVAVCGFLAAWRMLNHRFRSFSFVRALIERAASEPAARAESLVLGVGDAATGRAWNDLMSARDALRERAVLRETIEGLGTSGRGEGGGNSAVDALWIGVLLLGPDGKIRYANGAAAVMLGVRRDQLTGTTIADLLPDAALLNAVKDVSSGQSRQRTSVELERGGAGPDAERSVLRVTVKGLRKEDAAAALVMIEDVTQQRVADESRNAFVAQATHELRTPLTNMRLYIDTLVEEAGDPAVRSKCLNVISGESRRLERIVGDMLSVSEIEAGSLRLAEDDVRLDALFADLDADFRAQTEDREMILTFDLPPKLPVIRGDRDKLMLSLHNVVGNAVKYTPPGGAVRVVVREEGSLISVDVVDNGIGIRPDECERIFERFYRAKDKRIGSITGSGLGLALARQIARLHGGDIIVRSEIDKGSTFTLTLPSAPVAAGAIGTGGGIGTGKAGEQRRAA